MSEKVYISPQSLMDSSLALGEQIITSGFRPNFIVAVWRGGTPIGIVIQELYDYFGISTDHIAIRTSYYTGLDRTADAVRVHGLEYLIKNINAEDSLLIVDDVFDSGNSVKAALAAIHAKARRNTPGDIRIAAPYYKPGRNQTDIEPDYFVHKTDEWLVFPHEISGLGEAEIAKNKPWANASIERIRKVMA